MERAAGDGCGLIGEALEVELHPAFLFAVEGQVLEAGDIEIAAELAVDPLQEVEVEGGVEPGPVVVGPFENRALLLEIDPDQHLPLGPEPLGAVGKKPHNRLRLEIADGRPREKPDALPRRAGQRRQWERTGIIGADRDDAQLGEIGGEPGGGLAEIFARDVDRHIGGRRLERLQEDAHLAAGTAAQFHEPAMRAEMRRDRAGIFLEDRDLGAGQIVFRNLTDLLEQGRAAHIVEEFARQRLRVLSEPGEHRSANSLLPPRRTVKGEDAATNLYRSSAWRSPENAQRAAGGKKLR